MGRPTMSVPRYFIGRARPDASPGALLPPEHVIDRFLLGGSTQPEREWLVVSDALGRLSALPETQRNELPPNVQQELACNEIGGVRKPRRIDAAEVFLFHLQLVEQPVPAPGLDDPVYLYGAMFGAFPAGEGQFEAGVEGQFTVTRIDLLEGLVQGVEHAFRYPGNAGTSSMPTCFHLLLPGDREEAIRGGRGLVLAYPLLPTELFLHDPGNEIIIRQLWYDLLNALREDLLREGVPHPLCARALPVPSRNLLEQRLQSEGYEIEGEFAVRKRSAATGFRGILHNVLDALASETVSLPPEGRIADYLALSREALVVLPGFPPSRTVALRQRLNSAQPAHRFPVTNPVPPPVRSSDPVPGTVSTAAPRLLPLGRREPTDWMNDFIADRQPEKARPVRSVPPAVRPPRSTQRRGEPDWMGDFAVPSAEAPEPAESEPKRSDWTGDFT
jgi:hypothetical protein